MPTSEYLDSREVDSCELRAESLQDTQLLQQFIRRNNLLGQLYSQPCSVRISIIDIILTGIVWSRQKLSLLLNLFYSPK